MELTSPTTGTPFNERRIYEGVYRIFEEELQVIGEFIAFTEDNYGVYSNKIHELHLRVCSEIENVLKIVVHRHFIPQEKVKEKWESEKAGFLKEDNQVEIYKKLKDELNNKGKKELDRQLFGFPDFKFYYDIACQEFNLHQKIVFFSHSVSHSSSIDHLTPFEVQNGEQVPIWWTRYNKIKHDKIANLPQCTLKDLISALSGLFILMNYLLKYCKDNTPICDKNYFRDHPDRNIIDCRYWALPSAVFQISASSQSLVLHINLQATLDQQGYNELIASTGRGLDEVVDTVSNGDPEWAKKERCVFHTYFDYQKYMDSITRDTVYVLERYGKFVN